MATARQIERFFEGTGVQVEDMVQGREGFIHLSVDGQELVITASVQAASDPPHYKVIPRLELTYTKKERE